MKLAIIAFIAFCCGNEYSILDITKCSSSGKTSTVDFCYLDASRKISVFSLTISEKLVKVNMTMSLQQLIDGKFRPLFKVFDFDWCKFMSNDFRKTSPVVKIIVDAIRDSSSGSLLHPCPYIGEHKANVSIKKSIISMAPFGTYRILMVAHNYDDAEVIAYQMVVKITAS